MAYVERGKRKSLFLNLLISLSYFSFFSRIFSSENFELNRCAFVISPILGLV
uniref:Uncharacterized protein n=1 Tax=Rhizophora mucronata TaxID=61149 RepID=A0A2P2IU06_RHIMU